MNLVQNCNCEGSSCRNRFFGSIPHHMHVHTHTYTHNCIFAPQFVVTNSFSGLLKVLLLLFFFKEGGGQRWNVIYRDRTLTFLIVSNKKPHCSWQWHLLGTQYLLPLYSFVCYTMFQKLVTFLDLGCVSLHRFHVWKQDTDETRVSSRLRNHNILSIVNFCLESKRCCSKSLYFEYCQFLHGEDVVVRTVNYSFNLLTPQQFPWNIFLYFGEHKEACFSIYCIYLL